MNIYLITTEDRKVFGVGQTTRSYEERHKDGDWAKFHHYLKVRGEEIILLGWWENTDVLDTTIHKYLLTLPNIRKSSEWFSHKNNLDIIKDKIEKKFFSTTPEKKINLQLHKHQKEFVAKAQADYLEFLLFAKCRSGKSVMVLTHIINTNRKVTLVVSRYTSPMQSWRDDSTNFSNFDNLVFIDVNDKDYIQQIDYWYNTDKQLILWGCVQSRKILELPVDVDLLVYDEAHIGYNSGQWNKLREVTKCPVLYVTGTAYKMVWDFTDSQRYIYSYFEEQLDKKKGLNNRPSMNVILAKYESAQYQAIFGDDPDAMKNLFQVDSDGNFLEPTLVQDFITNRFATQRTLRPQNRLLKDATHLYMTLPSVDACYAFSKYMKGTRFSPLVVTGNAGKDADDINKHIEENPNGSIILTRTANVLGVTASKVDTIINCAEGSSIEFWTQFAFRGGSSDQDWNVIDFVPQRCLESLRQTYIAACDTSPEVAKYDFTDYVCITEWNDGFETLSVEQVNEILAADVGNAIRLVSGLVTSLDYDKLRDFDFNLDLKAVNSNVAKSIQINDNGANGKGNKKRMSNKEKLMNNQISGKIETIQAILERIPLVLYHSINTEEVMNNIDSVLNSSHYEPVTLDDQNIIRTALEYNIINRQSLSHRISKAYVDIQYAMQQDELNTLNELSKSTQSHQDIPLSLFDEMLTELSNTSLVHN
jgi:hypothetical protein